MSTLGNTGTPPGQPTKCRAGGCRPRRANNKTQDFPLPFHETYFPLLQVDSGTSQRTPKFQILPSLVAPVSSVRLHRPAGWGYCRCVSQPIGLVGTAVILAVLAFGMCDAVTF